MIRMEGEDVFGCKISLHIPPQLNQSNFPGDIGQPDYLYGTKNVPGPECKPHFTAFPPPPSPNQVAPPRLSMNVNDDHEFRLLVDSLSIQDKVEYFYFLFLVFISALDYCFVWAILRNLMHTLATSSLALQLTLAVPTSWITTVPLPTSIWDRKLIEVDQSPILFPKV